MLRLLARCGDDFLQRLGNGARCALAGASLFAALAPSASMADEVLLTISSKKPDSAFSIAYTRAELNAMPQKQIRTATEWTDGRPVFQGPLARDIIANVAGRGETIVNAIAINDYSVEIPLSDFERYDVILALTMDGRELSLRDRGPIWIVYPRDDHEELHDPAFNARWIWQLDRLELR